MAQPKHSRREVLHRSATVAAAAAAALLAGPGGVAALGNFRVVPSSADWQKVGDATRDFILRCARDDGGYAPSPDPDYAGRSDTSASDLAAVTYAAVLAKTMGWELPDPDRSVAFVQKHQEDDGRFVNHAGSMKPEDPLAVLYNTTQGAVSLRALGAEPLVDPSPVMKRFFLGDENDYAKLPWYTTSFFPLFYAALGKPFPAEYEQAVGDHMVKHQRPDDGYLQNHVAATFHMAHFFRMVGKDTPLSAQMIERTVDDQKYDGGWNIFEPDWDVHACFDALYILRQLGNPASPTIKKALARAAGWALRCQNDDGGFGHFPGEHSDMDAVYFQFGSLIQAGVIPDARLDLPDGHTLGWGHAMDPGRIYEN